MAKRKQPPPPPPPAETHSSEEDSSSSDEDEEQFVAKPVAPQAKNPKPTENENDESETDTGTESEAEPEAPSKSTPSKTLVAPPKKPEESEEEDSSEDEEEEEEEEKVKSPVKTPEAEPEKKKAKLSELDQSPSKKSASAMSRIWSTNDEIVLLRALSDYHLQHGKLPPTKDYSSLLSKISGSISFPVTEKQLFNKIRGLKNSFVKAVKKGPNVKITKPHEKAVFELCSKLFQDGTKTAREEVAHESSSDDTENAGLAGVGEANGGMANGSLANSDSDNDDTAAAGARSYVHLRSLVEEMISKQQIGSWLTVEKVIAKIGESKAQSLEAKAKALRIDSVKLLAKQEKLKAEAFGYLADGMANE